MRDELIEENTRRERWEKWGMHVQTKIMIEFTRDNWIINSYLDQSMKMVGDSYKTSSKRICIGVQNHLDLWFLVFTSFLQFLQIFFKVLFVFKSCWALLSLNFFCVWNFFGLESLPTCCVHKYSFVSKLVSCLELLWSRVSFNYLWSLSRGVRNSRELMVIQRQIKRCIK